MMSGTSRRLVLAERMQRDRRPGRSATRVRGPKNRVEQARDVVLEETASPRGSF